MVLCLRKKNVDPLLLGRILKHMFLLDHYEMMNEADQKNANFDMSMKQTQNKNAGEGGRRKVMGMLNEVWNEKDSKKFGAGEEGDKKLKVLEQVLQGRTARDDTTVKDGDGYFYIVEDEKNYFSDDMDLEGGRLGFFRYENKKLRAQVKTIHTKMDKIENLIVGLSSQHPQSNSRNETKINTPAYKNTKTSSLTLDEKQMRRHQYRKPTERSVGSYGGRKSLGKTQQSFGNHGALKSTQRGSDAINPELNVDFDDNVSHASLFEFEQMSFASSEGIQSTRHLPVTPAKNAPLLTRHLDRMKNSNRMINPGGQAKTIEDSGFRKLWINGQEKERHESRHTGSPQMGESHSDGKVENNLREKMNEMEKKLDKFEDTGENLEKKLEKIERMLSKYVKN